MDYVFNGAELNDITAVKTRDLPIYSLADSGISYRFSEL